MTTNSISTPAPPSASLPLAGILRMSLMFALYACALGLFSGNIAWWRGWLFLAVNAAIVLVNVPLVRWKNPALFAERFKRRENTKRFDKVFAALFMPCLLAPLAIGGLDFRWGWSSLPDWSAVLGAALMMLGDVPVVAALMTNPHLETTVRIQDDRAHRVISAGPYRVVRHPMYSGLILQTAGWPLLLGSTWAVLPYVYIVGLLVWRTALEDRTLRRELAGYEDYSKRTRYRLVPLLW